MISYKTILGLAAATLATSAFAADRTVVVKINSNVLCGTQMIVNGTVVTPGAQVTLTVSDSTITFQSYKTQTTLVKRTRRGGCARGRCRVVTYNEPVTQTVLVMNKTITLQPNTQVVTVTGWDASNVYVIVQ